ncbi:MAG: ABC transporter substrate-binding protein [Clostridiaceae bacterium]|nr:ABC transporter substrate-binding protein [Clostridiaceae bacterium]
MNKTSKKLMALTLAAGFAFSAFTGCGAVKADDGTKNETNQTEQTTQKTKDTLVVVMESEPPTLHPFDHKAVTAGYMNTLTFNQLFKTDPETLEPVPDLCKSYEQLDDTTWQFTIYDNVTFHDGSHMTAEDVVASMEWAKTFSTTKDYTSFWSALEVVDEYTVKVTTNGPYALTLLDLSSIKIVPKALIDSGHDFGADPVGSGPYKFVSQTLGDKIEFEAFDQYFDTAHAPKIKYLTWRIVPEGSSRTIALEAGEADFIVEVETNDLERLESMDTVEVQTVSGTRVNFLTVNNEVPPFDNQYFRKAVNAAIDKEAVLTVALNGQGKAAYSMCPTAFEGTSMDNTQKYDVEKAKEYLKLSGIDPTTVSFSCIVSTDTARRAAEVIQACLQELGIQMSIESMDYAAYLNAVMGGGYTAAVSGYTSTSLARYLMGVFHSSAINAANMPRVQDAKVDELINLAKTQTNLDDSKATYEQVTAYLNELTPFAPLYESVVTRAYNADLKGVVVGASGSVRFEDLYWAD